jgi:hypothetical protein
MSFSQRRVPARLVDLSIVVTATVGLWLFWAQYSNLAALSWWYENTNHLRTRTTQPKPDYELTTLPWRVARARVFDFNQGTLTVVSGAEPFDYQAYAIVNTGRAAAADLQFDAELQSGGATIGLLQAGKWIAVSSSKTPGVFAESNSAQLGYNRSVTLVIANDNPAGESRLVIKSLRLFFRNSDQP